MTRKVLLFVVPAAAIGLFLGAWGSDGVDPLVGRVLADTETLIFYKCITAVDVCPSCPAGTPRQGNSQCDTNIHPYRWGDCEDSYNSYCTFGDGTCGPDLDCINFPQQPTGGNNCDVGVYKYCA